MSLTDPEQPPPCRITQPALLSVQPSDAIKPNTLTGSLTLRADTEDHGAGWQADRWCADNAVSLERRTKALRAGQEIHLVEMGAGWLGGPAEWELWKGERVVGGLHSFSR